MKQDIHITFSFLQEARVGEAKKSSTLRPVLKGAPVSCYVVVRCVGGVRDQSTAFSKFTALYLKKRPTSGVSCM